MKAIVYHKFGSPDELKMEEVEKPKPKDNEVLVKIHAASVNSWDYDLVMGKPYVYRLLFGFFKPRYKIIGIDMAGRIEAIGKNVKLFKVGDEVFGDISESGFGAFAEYVCAPENKLALKLTTMSFEQAASIPHAGVLALQGMRMHGEIKRGQKILFNGAAGGVGTFGLQMAKHWGAEVTCVDKGDKLDILLQLGADHVIDYTKENFTKNGKQYDLIVDAVAKNPVRNYDRALNPGGAFVLIGGSVSTIFQVMTRGPFMGKKSGKKFTFLPHKPSASDLNYLVGLFENGILKPVIKKIFPFSKTAEAVRLLGEGRSQGKVVITME